MINLSKRQQTIIKIAKKATLTFDVGCDHGYTGATLLQNNKTKFLVASDISKKCAEKAKKLLKELNLEKKSQVFVCDGIAKTTNIPDQVLICGMGGKEIAKILNNFKDAKKVKHFVFQPMKELWFFRSYLSENGFAILKDFVQKDKQKFYHFLTAKPGKQKLSAFKQKWGAKKDATNDFFEWVLKKEQRIENILKTLPENNKNIKKFKQCKKDINILKRRKLC